MKDISSYAAVQKIAPSLDALFSKTTPLRPILTSLNGDASWLLSFPLLSRDRKTGKCFTHVVTDPLLAGPAHMNWGLFTTRLGETAAIQNGDEVEAVVQQIEKDAATKGSGPQALAKTDMERKTHIDAIIVSMSLFDHLNEETLRTFDPSIPIISSLTAIDTIKGWGYFDTVVPLKKFEATCDNWTTLHPGTRCLPSSLSVFQLPGKIELYDATIIVWSSSNGRHGEEPMVAEREAIFHTPHGMEVDNPNLQALLKQTSTQSKDEGLKQPDTETNASTVGSPIKFLAMLHGLSDNFTAGIQTTGGASGGLALYRALRSKYWVLSHDAKKTFHGLIPWVLCINDQENTLERALAKEEDKEGERPDLVNVGNGRCFGLN